MPAVMTSSKTKRRRHAAKAVGATGVCAVGLLLTLLIQTPLAASPDLRPPARAGEVNLRLDGATAVRLLAEEQTEDTEKPKSDEMKITVTKAGPNDPKPAAAASGEKDSLAFLKDWPFWVIVGGVIVGGIATYMIIRNSNQKPGCDTNMFDGGCHGAQ